MMQIICLIFIFVILHKSAVFGDISDFIISNEEDLMSLSNVVKANDYYDDDDEFSDENEDMMYDQCGGGGTADDADNYIDTQEVTFDDFNMMSDENSLMQKYVRNGQVDIAMLRSIIQKLARDPRYAALLAKGYIESNAYDVEESGAMCPT